MKNLANMDPADLRDSVQNDPGVLAVKAQQDRLKALANQNTEEIIQENNEEEVEVDDSGTITPTITGIREYTRGGRKYRLTLYSDGTSTEEDIGPVDSGNTEPPTPPVFDSVQGDPVEKI